MLTVLYVDESGSATINEAETVTRIRPHLSKPNGEGRGGVNVVFPKGRIPASAFYPVPAVKNEGDHQPEVFVMNSEGQTVARYRL